MKPTLLLLLSLLLPGGKLAAADFYWIDGTGAWNDISHWATTSGGNDLHFTIPSANDNVFFDENSFPFSGATVDFAGITARCRSFSIISDDGPRFETQGFSDLEVHGDFIIRGNVDWRVNGSVLLFGSIGEVTINTEGRLFRSSVMFVGNADSFFSIDSDFTSSSRVTITSGNVKFAPGVKLTGRWILVSRGAWVDFSGLVKLAAGSLNLYVETELAISLAECNLEFTGGNNILSLDGAPAIRFGSIHSLSGSLTIGENFSSDTKTILADSILLGSNGLFRTDLKTDYLALATGRTYGFSPGLNVEVGGMMAEGACGEPILLIGDEDVVFGANAGAVLALRHLYVENITVGGGQDWMAAESYGLGNVDGWMFDNANGPNRYWVGGTGGWADTNHWAYTSGGAPGACPPVAANDVFFDAQSFTTNTDTVFLPPGDWRAGTLDWREVNRPVTCYDAGARGLQLYGSCYLGEALNWERGAGNFVLNFRSFTPGREVLTYGRTQNLDLRFDRRTGGWELLDSLSVHRTLSLWSGRLNTNGHPISANEIGSSGKSFFDLEGSNLHLVGAGSGRSVSLSASADGVSGFNADGLDIYSPDSTVRLNVLLRNPNRAFASINSIHCAGNLKLRATNLSAKSVRVGTYAEFNLNGKIDSLFFSQGNNYVFGTDIVEAGLEVDYLAATGTCLEPIGLAAADAPYTLTSTRNQEVAYAELTGINATGPEWRARSSIDQGTNAGWVFSDELASRELYWVGGGGSWFDPTHWSESPGGPGGACLPTQIDDVVFNDASFPTPGDTVNVTFNPFRININDPQAVCRSFSAGTLTRAARLEGQILQVHGSTYLSETLRTGVRTLDLAAASGTNDLLLPGLEFVTVLLSGGGVYTLLDTLTKVISLRIDHGRLNTANYNLNVGNIDINTLSGAESNVAILDMGRSDIYVENDGGRLTMGAEPFVRLLSTGGTIFMPANGTASVNPFSPGLNIKFREGPGTAYLSNARSESQDMEARFGSVTFGSGANFRGKMGFDTLQLAQGGDYIIPQYFWPLSVYEDFRAIGNVCDPITIFTGTGASYGIINFALGATTRMDYVRLDRIEAVGTETYPAGRNSLNINDSSSGWSFETNAGVNSLNRFFLGEDLDYCSGLPPLLEPVLPDDFEAEFTWQDGSNSAIFQPPGAGTYFLTITFDGGQCAVTDSLTISTPAFALNLPNRYAVCGADSLRLLLPNPEAEGYSWLAAEGTILELNDSSALVTAPGRYYLRQQLLGCADSTEIVVIPGMAVTATAAVAVCQNTEYTTPLATYTIREDTTITERYMTADGCDSLLTTFFFVRPTSATDTLVELSGPELFTTTLAEYSIDQDTTITELYPTIAGCDSLRTYLIRILPPTMADNEAYYLPTAFSPNGDGANDYLTVYGAPGAFVVERLEVFDRWGGLVFETLGFSPGDASAAWNGEGRPPGVYVVAVCLRWPDGRGETVREIVHLMR